MATFNGYAVRSDAARRAMNLLPQLRNIYASGKQLEGDLALYQSGTDPQFNQAINAVHGQAERAEILQLFNQILPIIQDWEQNHQGAVGLLGEPIE